MREILFPLFIWFPLDEDFPLDVDLVPLSQNWFHPVQDTSGIQALKINPPELGS